MSQNRCALEYGQDQGYTPFATPATPVCSQAQSPVSHMPLVGRLHPCNFADYDSVSFTFGFRVPLAFSKFIAGLLEWSHGEPKKVVVLFERLTHLMLDGVNARYQQTPPELFPIASLGVDGVHYGYIIHAPELATADYPVAQFQPIDRGGALLVGRTTTEALENLVADVIASEQDDWQRQQLTELSQRFGLEPNIDEARRRRGIDSYILPVTPAIPQGWRHVASSDGIGVLAPSEKFASEELVELGARTDVNAFLRAADWANLYGYPATALYYLREGYWFHWMDFGSARRFSYRLAMTYAELNRPTLAEVAAWRVNRFFK